MLSSASGQVVEVFDGGWLTFDEGFPPFPIPRVPDRVRQFTNPTLTGSSLSLYSSKVFIRFLGEVLTSMPVCC